VSVYTLRSLVATIAAFCIGAPSVAACPASQIALPWQTAGWTHGAPEDDVDGAQLQSGVSGTFASSAARARALLVIHRGRVVVERYGDGRGPQSRLLSHSIAKFILGTAIGVLVGQGRLDLDAPVSGFAPRHRLLTIRHLMTMRSGLAWNEAYTNLASDLPETMLGHGRLDQARYVATMAQAQAPGARFSYSSGDANLLSGVVRDRLGSGQAYARFLRTELFEPLGLTSAEPGFDASGTFVGSSWFWATAQDYARIGYLHLSRGMSNGRRLLPEDWHSVVLQPSDAVTDGHNGYGALATLFSDGAYGHTGFRGQLLLIDEARDLVIVRFADTGGDAAAEQALRTSIESVRAAFPRRHDS